MKNLVFILILAMGIYHAVAQSDDIPNNCPNEQGSFYQQNLFPRYEAHSQRVVMVDWSSGAEVHALATGMSASNYYVQLWSPECQYLAIAFANLNEQGVELWDTYVWDVLNGSQLVVLENARLSPYPLTWDTNSSQLLVETRFGAYLWKLDGRQVWLTSDADYNAHSFQPGTIRWDYTNNQISAVLSISPYGTAVYDMDSGLLLSLSGRPVDANNTRNLDAQANENGERYACRRSYYYSDAQARDGIRVLYEPHNQGLVMRDAGSRELIRVVDAQLGDLVGNSRLRYTAWYLDCRFLRVSFNTRTGPTVLYDLDSNQRVLFIANTYIHQFDIDPTGTYVIATTTNGANLYHLPSGNMTPLIPNVRTNSLGSGRVWSYDTIEWDTANNQVRLGTTLSNSRFALTILQVHVFDLSSGALVMILDHEGQPLDEESVLATETQRTAPYGCRWMVRYQTYNQRIVLEDVVTRDLITVVEGQLAIDDFRYLGRSSDCRYIAASIGYGDYFDTIVWDLAEERRAGVFEDARAVPHQLNWSPYGGYVVVHTRHGGFLWYLPTDTRMQLNSGAINNNTSNYRPALVYNFHQIEWDMSARQLLAVPVEQADRVIAYDLNTGLPLAEYDIADRAAPVNFIQIDANRLLVFTARTARENEHRLNGLALWNRASSSSIQLAMDYYVVPTQPSGLTRGYPQFSPDGSLMLMRSRNYVYIWDLNGLAESEPYLPNYIHQLESTRDVHFIDNHRIASFADTSSPEQWARRILELTTYEYDVVSGALLSETIETSHFSYFEYIALPH